LLEIAAIGGLERPSACDPRRNVSDLTGVQAVIFARPSGSCIPSPVNAQPQIALG
jgi:hypothetical protein